MTTVEITNRKLIGETYQKIRHEVYSIFRQACIPEETCDDLVQEVFLKLLSMDIIIADQLKGLTITMAYRKRTDYLRRRAIINKVHDDLRWQMERSYADTHAETNDLLRIEMKAVSQMSDIDGSIYRMTRFEEKTADEIMLATGLSKRAVESRIYRTRNLVRSSVRTAMKFCC